MVVAGILSTFALRYAGLQRRRLRLPRHPRARLRFESSAPASRCSCARGRVDQGPHGRTEGRRRRLVQRRRREEDELMPRGAPDKSLPSNNYLLGHITSNDRHHRPAPSTRGRGRRSGATGRLLPAAAARRPRPELSSEARVRAALRPPILDDAERLAGGQGAAPDEVGGDGRARPRHAGPAVDVRNFSRPSSLI